MGNNQWTMNCVIFGANLFKSLYRGQISKDAAIAKIKNLSSELTDGETTYLLKKSPRLSLWRVMGITRRKEGKSDSRICVGVAFAVGFSTGCAFMVWVGKTLANIEAAIENGCRAASV